MLELSPQEKRMIVMCIRDAPRTSNLWVKLIAKLWEHIQKENK